MRDKGICSICGVDGSDYEAMSRKAKELGKKLPEHRNTFWDAHHMTQVCEGGDNLGVGNIETVCVLCHEDFTVYNRESGQYDRYEDYSEFEEETHE